MRRGHSLSDIGDYTLSQFTMFLEAAHELEASERMSTVTDLSAVVSSLFAGKNPPIVEHMEGLADAAQGVRNGDESK